MPIHFSKMLRRSLAATLLSTSLAAQIHITAMLNVTGSVTVNGTGIPATTAVVSGDTIQTANNGAATLSLPGSAIAIPANSAVLFRGDSLEVQTGTVGVNTTQALRARVERLTVAPAAGSPARFEVTRLNGSIVITAQAGTLTITGAGTTTLEPGKSAILTDGSGGTPQVLSSARVGSHSAKAVSAAGLGGGVAVVASTVAVRKRAGDASPVHP